MIQDKLIILVVLLSLFINAKGQVLIGPRYGFMIYNSKTLTPIQRQKEEIDLKQFIRFEINNVKLKKDFYLNLSYSFYRGWVHFNVISDGFWRGNGSSSTDIHRFGPTVSYELLKDKPRLRFQPYLGCNFEIAHATSSLYTQRAYISEEKSVNFEGFVFLELVPRNQIVPVFGAYYSWRFLWRANFVIDYHYVFGYKPFQKYYFEYTYNDVEQPTAEWFSDGTGHFISIGLSFDIGKLEKKK